MLVDVLDLACGFSSVAFHQWPVRGLHRCSDADQTQRNHTDTVAGRCTCARTTAAATRWTSSCALGEGTWAVAGLSAAMATMSGDRPV